MIDPSHSQQQMIKSQVSFEAEIIRHHELKFKQIMKLDGIKETDIMQSLDLNDNVSSIFKSGEGMGKSGSFFFFSKDQKFVIKTMRRDEKTILINMLDDMIVHLNNYRESLLVRIYGIFTLKTKIFGSVDIILMENTFQSRNQANPF